MGEVSIEFETGDWAGWLWAAAGALAALELIRYAWVGGRPASTAARVGLAAGFALVMLVLVASDRVRAASHNPVAACLVLAILVAVWVARACGQTPRTIGPRARIVLIVLRCAAAGVVLLMIAHPVLKKTEVTRRRPILAIAIDGSRSMSIRDVAEDPGRPDRPILRREAVQAALEKAEPVLRDLVGRLDVRWFRFDARAAATTQPTAVATGDGTALAEAIGHVREALARGTVPAAGVVLVSDGRDNASVSQTPESAAAALSAAGIALYAAGVGSERPAGRAPSLEARRLVVPERTAVHNRMAVQAEFLASGLAGRSIRIDLLVDGLPAATQEVEVRQAVDLVRADLSHIPGETGLHRVTVRAIAPAAESPAETSQFVQVDEDRIHVLYVDRPRHERAAIARALAGSDELRVTRMELPRPLGEPASAFLSLAEEEWSGLAAFLIGDVGPEAFPAGTLEAIARAVRGRGAGLALLGGSQSLESGAYARTPLGDLVPVGGMAAATAPGAAALALTPAGRSHPICRLAPDAAGQDREWKQLPPSARFARFPRLAPADEVLVQTPAGEPLLVVRQTSGGRTAAVAFDDTWRWSFAAAAGAEAQRRFWRQLVLWLAQRRPRVRVTTDRQQVDLDSLRQGRSAVRVRAGVTDRTTGRPPADVTLTATLQGAGGPEHPIRLVQEGDEFTGEVRPEAPGDYRVRVTARAGGAALGESQAAFVVTASDRELSEPRADLQRLRRMAGETQALGGSYVPVGELPSLLRQAGAAAIPVETRDVRRWSLVRDEPWVCYAVFVGLVAADWALRRRRGLV